MWQNMTLKQRCNNAVLSYAIHEIIPYWVPQVAYLQGDYIDIRNIKIVNTTQRL